MALSDPASLRRKELGAFYTPPAMAEALVDWAIRSPDDTVFDPSFGGLVFLQAATKRLNELGATPSKACQQVYGAELDQAAHAVALESALLTKNLVLADFFALDPGSEVPTVEAVVGNPPYVRYQGFNGNGDPGHLRAEAAGVKLTRLASSWAPFIVHATSFVAPGGRMAQVLPAELLHAQYAAPVLEFLGARFAHFELVGFEERVFPGALEEVVLLLASGHLEGHSSPSFRTVTDLEALNLSRPGRRPAQVVRGADRGKLLSQLLPTATQRLYERIEDEQAVRALGELASVDIGAVTGANNFFLLTETEAEELSPTLLRPTVSKAAQIPGAIFDADDLEALAARRYLLFCADAKTPAGALATADRYLRRGKRAKIDQRFKCRTRDPWWAVPLPVGGPPELLMTYCASRHPRLAVNSRSVLNTNTLHGVRLIDKEVRPRALATGFINSLTLLSAELVGRSYGGGVLKLEPTEAEAVLVPPLTPGLSRQLGKVDRLVRDGNLEAALDLVDPLVLGHGLGLSRRQILSIRRGAAQLAERRAKRGRTTPRS